MPEQEPRHIVPGTILEKGATKINKSDTVPTHLELMVQKGGLTTKLINRNDMH